MEIAAFASFAVLVIAWIVLPVRAAVPVATTTATAPTTLSEAVAA